VESLAYFRRATAADKLFLKALENVDNACSSLVERWHFRMLNDTVRNSAFHRAITSALDGLIATRGDVVVLDIGTGSGILRYDAVYHIIGPPALSRNKPMWHLCYTVSYKEST